MKRNIQYTSIIIIFVLLSIWQPTTNALSNISNEIPGKQAANSFIYLPIITKPSCPPADGIRLQFSIVTSGNIGITSEVDTFNFCGTAGDIVRLDISQTSGSFNPDVDIYRADGSLLCSESTVATSLSVECTLDVTGTYVILIGDWAINDTGGYAFYLQRLNNPTGSVPVNYSDVVPATITSIVEHDTYNFSGTAGDIIRLDISQTSGGFNPDVDIYRADGSLLCAESIVASSLSVECTLDITGTYVILIGDWAINDTGGYTFSLSKLN